MPKRTDIRRISIVGSGLIVIGQACEFDYSGTQVCTLKRESFYSVLGEELIEIKQFWRDYRKGFRLKE
jgi:hypothetical protein